MDFVSEYRVKFKMSKKQTQKTERSIVEHASLNFNWMTQHLSSWLCFFSHCSLQLIWIHWILPFFSFAEIWHNVTMTFTTIMHVVLNALDRIIRFDSAYCTRCSASEPTDAEASGTATKALPVLRDMGYYTFIVSLKIEWTNFNLKLMRFFMLKLDFLVYNLTSFRWISNRVSYSNGSKTVNIFLVKKVAYRITHTQGK